MDLIRRTLIIGGLSCLIGGCLLDSSIRDLNPYEASVQRDGWNRESADEIMPWCLSGAALSVVGYGLSCFYEGLKTKKQLLGTSDNEFLNEFGKIY